MPEQNKGIAGWISRLKESCEEARNKRREKWQEIKAKYHARVEEIKRKTREDHQARMEKYQTRKEEINRRYKEMLEEIKRETEAKEKKRRERHQARKEEINRKHEEGEKRREKCPGTEGLPWIWKHLRASFRESLDRVKQGLILTLVGLALSCIPLVCIIGIPMMLVGVLMVMWGVCITPITSILGSMMREGKVILMQKEEEIRMKEAEEKGVPYLNPAERKKREEAAWRRAGEQAREYQRKREEEIQRLAQGVPEANPGQTENPEGTPKEE